MLPFIRRHSIIFSAAIIFAFAFVMRAGAIKQYVTPDEPIWALRSLNFATALSHGDWAATAQIGHPGVTTMWLGSIGILLKRLADPAASTQAINWLQHVPALAPDNAEALKYLGVFLTFARLPVILINALGVAGIFLLARKLFGHPIAFLAALLIALDPFIAGLSGLLHVDGLLTTFSTLSVLALLIAIQPSPQPFSSARRGIMGNAWFALAGLLAALAFLSKSPAIFLTPFTFLAVITAVLLKRISLRSALLGLLALAANVAARAEEPLKAKIGVLRLSSSAPVFIAQDKGYFRDAGLDIELKFFDAAQPIAVATTSGDVDFGITAFTAGLYNLAGKGTLKVIGGMSREKAGYPLIGYFASNNAYAAGLKTPKDLAGKRVAMTQVGSSFHYSLGLLADKYGFKLADVKIVPLQAMPATMEALKGKQVDAILVPQPFPGAAEAQGFGKILAWAGDLYPWQIATVFYSDKLAADRARAVAFMKGYVKASRYYFDAALVQKDGHAVHGANYDEVVEITAKYTGARPEIIKLGFPFQDRNGRLLVPDIERQMSWWTANGFMKKTLPLKAVVDTSFVEEAVRALRP